MFKSRNRRKKGLILVTLIIGHYAMGQIHSTNISGNLGFLSDGDSIILRVHNYGYFSKEDPIEKDYTSISKDHLFHFNIEGRKIPFYVDLIFKRKRNPTLAYYLCEPGDDITLSETNNMIRFSGKGAEKFNIQFQQKRVDTVFLKDVHSYFKANSLSELFSIMDSSVLKKLYYLQSVKGILSGEIFDLLKADCLAMSESQKVFYLKWLGGIKEDSANKITWASISKYKTILVDSLAFDCFKNNNVLIYSNYFADYILDKYLMDSCLRLHRGFIVSRCYTYLVKRYSGQLRERLITNLIYENRNTAEDFTYLIRDALSYFTNTDFRSVLLKLKSSRMVAAEAPAFSVQDVQGKAQKLMNFKNRVVLLDFWFTGCGACKMIHPYLDSIAQHFKGRAFSIISISIDIEKNMWLKSVREGKYSSIDNMNVYTNGLGDKHSVIADYFVDSYPTLILIDKNSKIMDNPVDPRIDGGKNLEYLINLGLRH